MQDGTDKVIINLDNWDGTLREYLSRKEPMEKCKFVLELSLDEIAEKMASFSIDHIKVLSKEASEPKEGEEEVGAVDETEGVMEWARKQMSGEASPETEY